MSNLETKLRQLAENGELTYLSLTPLAGKGGIVFCAQVSPASRFGHSEGRDADPVNAIHAAIDGLPKSFAKTKASKRNITVQEAEPWEIVP